MICIMQTDTEKHAGDKVYREVKKCADNGDIRGLRYIFHSCLDVDPTFKGYERAYEDYKNTPGLFVDHTNENLMKLKENNVDGSWNLEYWNQLKKDLLENFSQKRFEHMREVAKVVYKDKICRIEEKRHQPDKTHVTTVEEKKQNEGSMGAALKFNEHSEAQRLINEQIERERRDKERKQKELEENNASVEKEEQQKEAERRKRMQSYNDEIQGSGGGERKKVMGVVLAIVAVMIIVFMIINII